jgi:methyl-accepting chemotaxis protein
MDTATTLLEQMARKVEAIESGAEELAERVANLEAMAGRAMHPGTRESAEDAARRVLELARATDNLSAVFADLAKRVEDLELALGRVQEE